MEYKIKLEHKGESIEVKPVEDKPHPIEYQLFISGKKTTIYGHGHPFLSNKQLVCKIYSTLLNEINSTPKGYFKSLDFPELVEALRVIVAADMFLRHLRSINSSGGRTSNDEQIRGECHAAVNNAINFEWDGCKKFSDPQRWVLNLVSSEHIGGKIAAYDLEQGYDAVKDDDSELITKVREFEKFPFTKFISESEAETVLSNIKDSETEVRQSIATFRKLRDIAGNDLVNWGPHKYASQVKRAGIKDDSYRARSWLLNTLKDHLLKKGIKPAEVKASSVAKLKAKYSEAKRHADADCIEPVTVSQEELVKLFKAAGESQAPEYVRQMTPATAVSLLSLTTKNVVDKLIYTSGIGDSRGNRPHPALQAISNNVASGTNPAEFHVLIDYLTSKQLNEVGSWELYFNHVGHFSNDELILFAKHGASSLPEGQEYLTQDFFNAALASFNSDRQYTVNALITDAFLRYSACDNEKIRFLDLRTEIRISWDLSACHFQSLPYPVIKEFLLTAPSGVSHRIDVHSEWKYFLDLIIQNKDAETAKIILLGGDTAFGEIPYSLFRLFDFATKVEILENTKRRYIEIKSVIDSNELKDFGRIALTKENLCQYIPQLPVADLNQNIVVADVTQRVQDGAIFLPLTDKIVKAMSKDAAKRILARGSIVNGETPIHNRQKTLDYTTIELKRVMYSKLTREEILDLNNGDITQSWDFMSMADFMTPDELSKCCDNSVDFLRLHLAKIPAEYIARFRDKAEFKRIVGDRRDRKNNQFGDDLESRLAALDSAA